MAGMYPNNQDIEIFGEQVSWPGVDANGKITNGSFSDPMVKPSFIPAETINLVLDNLTRLIETCGGTLNAVNQNQLADVLLHFAEAKKIILRDENGRARVAAPEAGEDIARLAEVNAAFNEAMSFNSASARISRFLPGRDLMSVLGVSSINDAMAALRTRCNGTGTPDFLGLQIGDYLDGIDLSAIPVENGGTTGQPWNNSYKNNRIVLSAFNPYKGVGDTETIKNHITCLYGNG